MNANLRQIQELIDKYKNDNDSSVGDLSDGYHTFNELYKHRTVLTALVMMNLPYAWKALKHEDGTMFDNMFIVGFPTPSGMITYHYDMEYFDLFKVPILPHAPHFDGHTPDDVIKRITDYINSSSSYLINSSNIDKLQTIVENEILPVFNNLVDKSNFISFYMRKR